MQTLLYDRHVELGAKMVPFAGFDMPLSYQGVVDEHLFVRNSCGIFDVSHMGLIEVRGPDNEKFLDQLIVGHIKGDGSALYTLMCHEEGGCVDDLLLYKIDAERFWLVVNAGNRAKDLAHIKCYQTKFAIDIVPFYDKGAIFALQGPKSEEVLPFLAPKAHTGHFVEDIFIAGTGYTGEKGYELYVPNDRALEVFNTLIERGANPCGLGSRDTLRLEMGYALYGHELNDEMSPLESVAAWAIKMDKEFIGKSALKEPQKRVVPLIIEKGIARQGDHLFQKNRDIGIVTSGNFSPSLKRGIALGLVAKEVTGPIEVEIRGRKIATKEVNLPFYRR